MKNTIFVIKILTKNATLTDYESNFVNTKLFFEMQGNFEKVRQRYILRFRQIKVEQVVFEDIYNTVLVSLKKLFLDEKNKGNVLSDEQISKMISYPNLYNAFFKHFLYLKNLEAQDFEEFTKVTSHENLISQLFANLTVDNFFKTSFLTNQDIKIEEMELFNKVIITILTAVNKWFGFNFNGYNSLYNLIAKNNEKIREIILSNNTVEKKNYEIYLLIKPLVDFIFTNSYFAQEMEFKND
ncbi:hypothetical protein NPX79_00230 [Spiroplasma endosymbiont of Anurida maritima]|uniref:hypothetical protein n=1 Tax=Spiroplasma endosymbiont of Anurida maritima TaxID=2967972 RepID=UPI0036D23EF7